MNQAAALRFVREEVILADGRRVGEALDADPWIERDLLRPIFERDEHGGPAFRLVYCELPRGHWKSGAAAAVALAESVLVPDTDVVIAAVDTEQARIVLEHVDGYTRRNPSLGVQFKAKGDERLTADGSRIRVIASDAASAYGLGGTHSRFRVIADELTAWANEDLWTALASGTGKTRDAATIVLSNAGFDKAHSWQWRVRATAEQEPWGHLFSADGVVASWVTPQWIASMRALLPGPAFDRLIRNTWTSETGDFVTAAQWARCVDHGHVPLLAPRWHELRQPRYAGLDLGLTRDRTALAVVHHDGERITLDSLDVLEGSRSEPVSISQVERLVLDLGRRFPGVKVLADPWQLQGSIQRLRGEVTIEPFAFSATSVQRLSASLYECVADAVLRVYPDEELEREILGLRVVQTAAGWKFDHRSADYSDRAVALAMAAQACMQKGAPSTGLPPVVGGRPSELLGAMYGTADRWALEASGKMTDVSYGMSF